MEPSRLHFTHTQVALSIKAAAIMLATLTIYFQDLTIVIDDAIRSELTSHILAIPFLLAYLIYRKRKMLKAVIPFETSTPTGKTVFVRNVVGALLCLLAFLLYWQGSYTFYPLEYHMFSLPLFIAGLILLIFNTGTLKVLAFPIALLLFLTPPPSEIVNIAGATLSTLTSEVSYKILEMMGLPVSLLTEYGAPVIVLNLPGSSIPFAIDIACSGIYSLMVFSILVTFLTYIVRGSAWKRAIPILAGLPLIYALSILRIVVIVLIGYWQGTEAALKAFHIFGGYILIFLGMLLLLTLSEKVFKIQIFGARTGPETCVHREGGVPHQNFCAACGRLLKPTTMKISRRDLFKIVSIAICGGLIMLIQVPVFALTQGPAEAITYTPTGMRVSRQIFPMIPDYELKFFSRDTQYENITKVDVALIYAYVPANLSNSKTVLVGLEVADSLSKFRRWESCLITWYESHGRKPIVTSLDLRDVQLLENPPITGRFVSVQYIETGQVEVILYWREGAIFKTDSGLQQKYAQISLVAYTENPEEYSEIEDSLLTFAKAIINYWQTIETWSSIALAIAQHGYIPITILVLTLPAITVIHTIKNRRQRKINLKVFNRLALEEERLILKAVHQAIKEGRPTGNAIAASYQKLTGKTIDLNTLMEKLEGAEKSGLVKREVISQEDEPVLVWKSQYSFPNQNDIRTLRTRKVIRKWEQPAKLKP